MKKEAFDRGVEGWGNEQTGRLLALFHHTQNSPIWRSFDR